MKPRRVVLTVEVETDAPLNYLRSAKRYRSIWVRSKDARNAYYANVKQVSANVIRAPKKRKGKR